LKVLDRNRSLKDSKEAPPPVGGCGPPANEVGPLHVKYKKMLPVIRNVFVQVCEK